ncbi:MAG: glycoside hydrolase family 36 protein [Armatimonadota bacterium]|nr:alpha-galactosidase [bacterium]
MISNDAVVKQVTDWAESCFVGNTAEQECGKDAGRFLASTGIPFSFVYGGSPSSDILCKWNRSVKKDDREDRVCYSITWNDPDTGLAVTADLTAFKGYPAVDWLLYFENKGASDTPIIENIQALDIRLNTLDAGNAVVLHQLHGDEAFRNDSFEPYDINLMPDDSHSLAPTGGRPSSLTAFPFWNMQYKDRGIVTAIGWSGQWAAAFDRSNEGVTTCKAGMEKTHLLLHPGEKIRSPRVLLMFWQGNIQDSQNQFRRLMLSKYVPQKDGAALRLPICLQTYDRYKTEPGWATEQGQIEAANAARELGCNAYWFDAAWFPGDFPDGAGNWYTKPDEFPNGLKPVGEHCKKIGMDFILWFEPCRVAPGTWIAREHQNWLLGSEDGGLFNLGNPDALKWLTDLLSERIGDYGVTVYREDYNLDPLEHWRGNDTPDRQGMTEIRFVEGHYAMWDALRERHPGLWIDNCASGGRRIDLETCMRSVPLWRSDSNCWAGNPELKQMQNAALSQFVPLNTSCAWDADSYTLRSATTGGLICQFAYLDPAFNKSLAQKLLAEVKENGKYWYGDLYTLTPITTSADQFMAYQWHRPDLDEGIIMAFRRAECASPDLLVSLRDVDAAKTYDVEFVDGELNKSVQQISGEQLCKGLKLTILNTNSSLMVRYKPKS